MERQIPASSLLQDLRNCEGQWESQNRLSDFMPLWALCSQVESVARYRRTAPGDGRRNKVGHLRFHRAASERRKVGLKTPATGLLRGREETEGIVMVLRREKKNCLLDSLPEWQLGSQEETVARYRRLTLFLAF